MALWELDILDQNGIRQNTLPFYGPDGTQHNVSASGPARGVTSLTFHPRGSVLSAGGQLSFSAPLDVRKNLGLAPPNMVALRRAGLAGVLGLYLITERSHAPAGRYMVSMTCPDLTEELREVLVPGWSASLTDDIAAVSNGILQWTYENPWSANVLFNGYAGVAFNISNITIQQALGRLASERFVSWRLGDGRIVDIGRFGNTKSGIRLERIPGNRTPASNVRRIKSLTMDEQIGSVKNLIVASGGGSGYVTFDLSVIWNDENAVNVPQLGPGWQYSTPNFSSPWFDPNYPIFRRPIQAIYTTGIYQYFLYDHNSKLKWKRKEYPLVRSDINPISGAPLDVRAAGGDLYSAALAYLMASKDPNYTYKIVTEGTGDNRGIAGMSVRVDYTRVVGDDDAMAVHQDLVVSEVESKVSDKDGSWEDTWSVSTNGKRADTNATAIAGALEKIDYWNAVPMVFPTRDRVWIDAHVDAIHPVAVPLDDDDAVIGTVQAIFNVSLLPAFAPITGGANDPHSHNVTIPAISYAPASTPGANEKAYNSGGQGVHSQGGAGSQGSHNQGGVTTGPSTATGTAVEGTTTEGGGFTFAASGTLTINSGAKSSAVTTDGSFLYWPGGSFGVNVAGRTLGVADTTHKHNMNVSAPLQSGSAGAQGIGNYSGFAPTVTSAGTGFQPDTNYPGYNNTNQKDQVLQVSATATPPWKPVYGYYQDPSGRPSQITAWVNNTQVGGPFNADFSFNFTPYVGAKGAYTLYFKSATFGRLLIRGVLRQRESTVRIG